MVSCLAVPESLVVVGHDVDQVQVPAQGWEVVGLVQDGLVPGDGGGQDQTLALVLGGEGLGEAGTVQMRVWGSKPN